MSKIKRTLSEYKRILKVSRKPSSKEFKEIIKVTGMGMLAIGLIGFIVQVIFMIIPVI